MADALCMCLGPDGNRSKCPQHRWENRPPFGPSVADAPPWPEGYDESLRDIVRGGAYLSPIQCACLFDTLDAARAELDEVRALLVLQADRHRAEVEAARAERDCALADVTTAHGQLTEAVEVIARIEAERDVAEATRDEAREQQMAERVIAQKWESALERESIILWLRRAGAGTPDHDTLTIAADCIDDGAHLRKPNERPDTPFLIRTITPRTE